MNMANNSTTADGAVAIVNNLTWDDATWILTSSFIIFTMQSGRFLLENFNFITVSFIDSMFVVELFKNNYQLDYYM